MPSLNGESDSPHAPLELSDVLHIETNEGASLDFEVVGILEDPDASASYAVLWHEPAEPSVEAEPAEHPEGQFIVTDLAGKLLEDERLAQEILDDFLASAEES